MEPDSTSTRDTPASPTPPPFSPVSVWDDDILGDPLAHESEFAELIRLAGVGDIEPVQNEQQREDELKFGESIPV